MRILLRLQRVWHVVRKPFLVLSPARYVVLPLLVLLFALLASDQGQDSVRYLVEFDEECPRWGRILFFVASVSALALQTWYWARQLLRIDFAGISTQRDEFEKFRTWTPRVLGFAAYPIAIAALIKLVRGQYGGEAGHTSTVVVITCALLSAAAVAFWLFVVKRRRLLHLPPATRAVTRAGLGAVTNGVLGATIAVGALFCTWTAISPSSAGALLQSPSLIVLSAALWIGIGSFVSYYAHLYDVPIVGIVFALALVFSLWNDNHDVRRLPASAGGGSTSGRKTIGETFDAWYEKLHQKYPNESPHPVYMVAAEGGGIRAAYWTAAVLTELQDAAPPFSDHVFAISSVSGGSLGATVFTALVADRHRALVSESCPKPETSAVKDFYRIAAREVLGEDFLAPTLASMLHADLLQRFLPYGFIRDRARALETGWEDAWSSHVRDDAQAPRDDFLATGMLKMYETASRRRDADAHASLVPSLFLNSTSVETGNRVIASNCQIEGDIPDSQDLFDQLGDDMRLSTAALNSARFTYVSPAGTVKNGQGDVVQHIVDGGYFDNSAAGTADDILSVVDHRRDGKQIDLKLVLIKFDEPRREKPKRFATEALAPPYALLRTRVARGVMEYAHAKLGGDRSIEFVLAQEPNGVVLPLGWLLAARSRDVIDLQIGDAVRRGTPGSILTTVEQNVKNRNNIADILSRATVQSLSPVTSPVQSQAVKNEIRMRQAAAPSEGTRK